jgi:hypothetical protein
MAGALIALFSPLFGLCVYVAFSVARPQLLYGWAGDMGGLSRVVGVAVLAGWAFKAFGHWSLQRGSPSRPRVVRLFRVPACCPPLFASHQARRRWGSVIEQFKFFSPCSRASR